MATKRFLRLISSLLLIHLVAFSSAPGCDMHSSEKADAHHGHHAEQPGDAVSLPDDHGCSNTCPPATCATGAHCQTVGARVSSNADATRAGLNGSFRVYENTLLSVVTSPDPPPPRA